MHPYIIAPIITFVLSVGLGAYVILRDPKDRFRRAFFMLTFWTALAAVGEIGMLATTDAGLASRIFHIKWMGMAFIEPAVLDLVLSVSVWARRWDHPVRQFGIYVPPFVFILLDTMGDIMMKVQLHPWGYEAVFGSLLLLWILFWLLYVGGGIFVLAMDLKDKKSEQRPIYTTLLIGLLIPTSIISISRGLESYLGIPIFIATHLALILFLLFFELAIYRRRIFVLMPKKEQIAHDAGYIKLSLPPGHIYRIESEPPSVTYDLFRNLVISDLFGLVISRKPPDIVKEATCLIETPMVWISGTPKDGTRTVAPSEVGQIVQLVKDFIKKAEGTVILIDGLEFLLFQNGSKIILGALFLLSEIVATSNTRDLLPVDLVAIEPTTLALIQRETVDLRTVKGFERVSVGGPKV